MTWSRERTGLAILLILIGGGRCTCCETASRRSHRPTPGFAVCKAGGPRSAAYRRLHWRNIPRRPARSYRP